MTNNYKLGHILLLVIAIVLKGGIVEAHNRIKPCPRICYNAEYMICPTTEDLKLKPVCNCCLAPEGGCTLYLNEGHKIQCEKEHKICPLIHYDAKYMTCSYAGDKYLKPASNCCFAPKGCTLHFNNGKKMDCDEYN